MKIIWNKVTWYSKLLAVIVFAGVIWLGFYFTKVYIGFNKNSLPPLPPTQFNNETDNTQTLPSRQMTGDIKVSLSSDAEKNITDRDIKNAFYSVWEGTEGVYLIDGKIDDFKNKLHSEVTHFAISDLNNDGIKEAFVSINTSRADSMDELFLIKKENGKIFTQYYKLPLLDNAEMRNINSINIDNQNTITFSIDATKPSDPHCCPSIHTIYNYKFFNAELVKVD